MSDTANLVSIAVTSGLGVAIGSLGTAVIQSLSKRGESRAIAADRVTTAAGNLADRLDKINVNLEKENVQMRAAINALLDVMDEMLPLLPDEASRAKARQAIQIARGAIR